MTVKYTFFSDSAHGWLKVSYADLVMYGLTDKISSHSYRKNDWCYLEEDRDMSLFIDALKSNNADYVIYDRYTDGRSAIRNYQSYQPGERKRIKIVYANGDSEILTNLGVELLKACKVREYYKFEVYIDFGYYWKHVNSKDELLEYLNA